MKFSLNSSIVFVVMTIFCTLVSGQEKQPEMFFTVHREQTLYGEIGYDWEVYRDLSQKKTATLPKRTWIKPGDHLKIEKIESKGTVQYAKVVSTDDPKDSGWIRYDQLYFYDEGELHRCVDIEAGDQQNAKDILKFLYAKTKESKDPSGLSKSFYRKGANCEDYIKKDGSYGSRGEVLAKEILGQGKSSNRWAYFRSNNIDQMGKICPNFSRLTDQQKLKFWVWTFAAIAWDEGKCISNIARLDATNGVAAGDFQLPENWKDGRSWRGPGCDATEEKVQGVNAKRRPIGRFLMANEMNSIPCGVEIMGGAICGFYSTRRWPLRCEESEGYKGKALFGHHLYWEKLRQPSHGKVLSMVKEYPLCR